MILWLHLHREFIVGLGSSLELIWLYYIRYHADYHDHAGYAAYANHMAIQRKVAMTWRSWLRERNASLDK
jgi:hypothetical protein